MENDTVQKVCVQISN